MVSMPRVTPSCAASDPDCPGDCAACLERPPAFLHGLAVLALILSSALLSLAGLLVATAEPSTESALALGAATLVAWPAVLLLPCALIVLWPRPAGTSADRIWLLAAAVPAVLVALAAVPAVVDLCARPGGACG